MMARLPTAEAPLSKTLNPYQLHDWCSWTWALTSTRGEHFPVGIDEAAQYYLFLPQAAENMIIQTTVYLVMTLSHGYSLAKSKIRCSESISRHKPACTVSVKNEFYALSSLHLCRFKLEAFLPQFPPFLLNSLHSSFLASFKSAPHSTLSFSNSISFNSEVQFSAGALAISYRCYLHYLQLSHQAR